MDVMAVKAACVVGGDGCSDGTSVGLTRTGTDWDLLWSYWNSLWSLIASFYVPARHHVLLQLAFPLNKPGFMGTRGQLNQTFGGDAPPVWLSSSDSGNISGNIGCCVPLNGFQERTCFRVADRMCVHQKDC